MEKTTRMMTVSEVLQVTPVRMVVRGGSLWPLIANGNHVLVQSTHFREIRRGDIVAFKKHFKLICHQVIMRTDESLRTKAFSSILLDPPIREEDVLGRVVGIELPDGTVVDLNSKVFRLGSFVLASCGLLIVKVFNGFRGTPPLYGPEAAAADRNRFVRLAIYMLHVAAKILVIVSR